MKKILFNCSNLHSSGTVFVASSILMNIAKLGRHRITVALSPKVVEFVDLKLLQSSFDEVKIVDNTSVFYWKHESKTLLNGFDKVLTLFGPYYGSIPSNIDYICGCVNPLLIYQKYLNKFNLGLLTRFKIFVKNAIHKHIFNKVSLLIVETEDAKEKLSRILNENVEIQVIESAFNDYCNSPDSWMGLNETLVQDDSFNVGVLSSNYVYKNIKILNDICQDLPENSNIRFYTTISDVDFINTINPAYRNKQIINMGGLRYLQCPEFITRMDMLLCPSLLESCSSIPLDAAKLGKSVLLPNTSFNLCFGELNNFYFYNTTYSKSLTEELVKLSAQDVTHEKKYNNTVNSPINRAQKYVNLL